MCPEVADEASQGKEASPTGRVEVSRRCAVDAGGPDRVLRRVAALECDRLACERRDLPISAGPCA